LNDVLAIYNAASNFTSGYNVADLNGDGIADLSDIILASNNASNFVTTITPMTSPQDLRIIKENMKNSLLQNSKRSLEIMQEDLK
jgi:hypothetical protein